MRSLFNSFKGINMNKIVFCLLASFFCFTTLNAQVPNTGDSVNKLCNGPYRKESPDKKLCLIQGKCDLEGFSQDRKNYPFYCLDGKVTEMKITQDKKTATWNCEGINIIPKQFDSCTKVLKVIDAKCSVQFTYNSECLEGKYLPGDSQSLLKNNTDSTKYYWACDGIGGGKRAQCSVEACKADSKHVCADKIHPPEYCDKKNGFVPNETKTACIKK